MNREKLAWMISLLLLALLAFEVPHGLAQHDDDYAFVRTLVDIHRQVADNYVKDIDASKLEEGAIDGLLNQLDPYSVYIPPKQEAEFDRALEGNFPGVGIQLDTLPDGQVEVVSPIDDSPALKAGVEAGDIILAVNGESVAGLRINEVIKKIAGQLGTPVTLRLHHVTGEDVDLTIVRQEIVVPTVKGYMRRADNTWDYCVCDNPKIAYVKITQFTPDSADRVREAVEPLQREGMKGLILDLRWNPGGRLDEAVKLTKLFINDGVIVSTKGRNRKQIVFSAPHTGALPHFPMIVLVNEHSASAAEIVAGALMDNHRAVVLGTRTFGKGSVQEMIPLEGNEGKLKLTVAYWYLPSGRPVQRLPDAKDWGVDPQMVVPMDAALEEKIIKERMEQELFHRPAVKTSTHPTTAEAASQPTTQPVDTQLQAAVNALLVDTVFHNSSDASDVGHAPPATQSATQPQ